MSEAPGAGTPIGAECWAQPVEDLARKLIGCVLLVDGVGGTIVETEAYHEREAACHAHIGPTARNHVLFGEPGDAYVYLSYGIHHLLNIVAEPAGQGAAVLIRALEPTDGLGQMRRRRGLDPARDLCSGPGKLSQALAVDLSLNGQRVDEAPFRVLAGAGEPPAVTTGPRIGITKAAELPWRFCAAASPYISRPRPPGHRVR
ncbi:MAG: DNA-3-methyladenine glycosylase [Solirubrobacterales bacterium]